MLKKQKIRRVSRIDLDPELNELSEEEISKRINQLLDIYDRKFGLIS